MIGQAALGASLPFASCARHVSIPDLRGDDFDHLIDSLNNQIPSLLERAAVPGLSIALILNASIAWRRGFGVKDAVSRVAVDPDTVFEFGSISKTVFAYAVMKMCEQGLLSLDTPLTKYTTDRFVPDDPQLDLITARHVLTHSSGFQNWRSAQNPLRIHFPPGSRQVYSGEGYSYLQSVVSHLTGRVNPQACSSYEAGVKVCATDFDEYMRGHVLVPFGMKSSGYVWNDFFERRTAHPHDSTETPFARRLSATDAARYGAAGGLFTTPTDYARFLIEILAPKRSDAFRLTAASRQEMLRPQMTSTERGIDQWGLGWGIQQEANDIIIRHGGANPGFRANAAASLGRRSGFVIATNSDNGSNVIREIVSGERMRRFLSVRA